MRHPALDALDRQVDVIKWCRSSPIAGEALEIHRRQDYNRGRRTKWGKWQPAAIVNKDADAETTRIGYAVNIDRAATFWVSREMTELIDHAWRSLPYETLRRSDVPAECGWVEFARTLRVEQDESNDPLPGRLDPGYDAISWWVQPQDIWIQDTDGAELNKAGVVVTWWRRTDGLVADQLAWGATEEDAESHRALMKGTPFEPVFSSGYAFDVDPNRPGYYTTVSGMNQRQGLVTLWLLLSQELPTVSRMRANRSQARQIGRHASIVPEVIFVDLRKIRPYKEPGVEGDSEPVMWQHRWIVDGHWHRPYHPSCPDCKRYGKQCGNHSRVWIWPYPKGPEDKPLIIKDRVYRLMR